MSKILVTGGAGFIGYHTTKKFLELNNQVVAIDNINDYYDISLKEARINELNKYPNFKFCKIDITNYKSLEEIFSKEQMNTVIHLAAQAGVGYSFKNPMIFKDTNISGTFNLLELTKKYGVKNFIFASSSSVYGNSTKESLEEIDSTDHPISLYGATKSTGELLTHYYHKTFDINTNIFRFFSVYGPWGRPDMVMFKFIKSILAGKPIDVYNFGNHQRSFTYIDDIVEGIIKAISLEQKNPKFEIINLGNSQLIELEYLISLIENELNVKSIKNYLPLQNGDIIRNYPNINKAKQILNWQPKTPVEEGIPILIKWYKDYYKTK